MRGDAVERRLIDWGVWVASAGHAPGGGFSIYDLGESPKWGQSFQDYNPWASVPVNSLDAREVDDFVQLVLDEAHRCSVREAFVSARPRIDCTALLGITSTLAQPRARGACLVR
jgi:hypothetical protein